jgi:hypothetical protein
MSRANDNTGRSVESAVPLPGETLGELVGQVLALESGMVRNPARNSGRYEPWRQSVANYRNELARRMKHDGIRRFYSAGPVEYIVTAVGDGQVAIERAEVPA